MTLNVNLDHFITFGCMSKRVYVFRRSKHKIQNDRRSKEEEKKKIIWEHKSENRNEHLSFRVWVLKVRRFVGSFSFLSHVTFRISFRWNTCTTRVYRVPSTICPCACMFVHRSSYSSLNRIDNRHELNGQSVKQANPNPYSEILKYHFITIFSINDTLPIHWRW